MPVKLIEVNLNASGKSEGKTGRVEVEVYGSRCKRTILVLATALVPKTGHQ